ncbi:MAG: hypothetical protein MZV63_49190 [Marinilabiliales bacterium]|nr:hypothetical protein [Marinilabiliales bacterium]
MPISATSAATATPSAPPREHPTGRNRGFYLTIASFNEAEEGYFLAVLRDRKNLIHKTEGAIATLTEMAG